MNIKKLMKQAQEMQERMAREMEELRVESSAGGGVVRLTLSGSKQLLDLRIDPAVFEEGDAEMLQDMILAAWSEASEKVDEQLQSRMGGALPGLM